MQGLEQAAHCRLALFIDTYNMELVVLGASSKNLFKLMEKLALSTSLSIHPIIP